MDEAKSLFNMSISAMFSAMLIGAIMGIIGISYLMWSNFSKQDAASAKMTQYSNLTAFDNTTIRGSEVESLCSYADSLGIYVLFYDSSSTSSVLNDHTNLTLRYWYGDPKTSAYNTLSSKPITPNSVKVCNASIEKTFALMGTGSDSYPGVKISSIPNLHSLTHAGMVAALLDQSKLGSTTSSDSYGVFKATLIYTGDATSDVAAIALVRANSHVSNFCIN